jgi:beta-lactamase class D
MKERDIATDKLLFGNANTTGGKDKFLLSGGLRISPEKQIDFLNSSTTTTCLSHKEQWT